MTNRREFLQSGVAASILPMAMPAWAAGPGTLRLERFVFDTRFSESVEVAGQAARLGVELAEISGDMTDLWYRHFDLQWKRAPMTLAGMSNWHGLFVLETLAADRRMRVLYRGEHAAAKYGSVAHAFAGPAGLLERIRSATDVSPWHASLGTAMAECPAGQAAAARCRIRTPATGSAARGEALYSWIIAPRASVAFAA